jgi:hypothetical protein
MKKGGGSQEMIGNIRGGVEAISFCLEWSWEGNLGTWLSWEKLHRHPVRSVVGESWYLLLMSFAIPV